MGQVVTLEDNFGMKRKFTKYLKENCRKHSDEQYLFRYFLNIAFVREISPNPSGNFGCYRHEWVELEQIILINPVNFYFRFQMKEVNVRLQFTME